MITQASLESFSKAALTLYAPHLHSGNWVEHASAFLLKIVEADMVNFGALDVSTGMLEATTTCDGSAWFGAVEGFGACMKKYPYFCFDPSVNGGRPFFRSDFISRREFRDLDIFTECFRILETMDHAAIHVPSGDGKISWFALERGKQRDFCEKDRVFLTLAQDHLINSHRLAMARMTIRNEFVIKPFTFCGAGFTPRQSEVAYLLTEGKTNAEIATLMGIRLQTVKAYITELFNRCGAGNRLALTLHLLELARKLFKTERPLQIVPVRS